MKFIVTRVSSSDQPCAEAFEEEFSRIDQYPVDDPEKTVGGGRNWWYSVGENHRIENGCITRDIKWTEWVVEINKLDGLIAFNEKYGPLIIDDGLGSQYARITIYDDYIE